ncbi:MAG: helix-turn-helix domain-containing protein [Melioribacteraceae bacterium]|nr:helix-turn-helix domain-containing protein [Melioribacteraceae bacterium]MCF8353546.1 helix-turn-helix domain-containing protein [Melioribacteraceae bacterium]MCF8392520.1 helix-turn-helix domain-containing protein [Melioribacteraceae bacterium]MCF8418465.1 helix-turn-helix domain-containing protein [Melioribacteraceae bacterium]
MTALKIYTEDILDSRTEIHYAFHKSLQDITVRHTHDFYEIFLITKGSVKHIINDVNEVIEEGTLVFIRPHDIHQYTKNESDNCELINLAFTKSTIDQLFDYLGDGFNRYRLLNSKFPPSIILSSTERELVKKKIERLHLIPHSQTDDIRTNLRILLIEIMIQYFSKTFWKEGSSKPKWLELLRTEMQKKENFTKGFKMMVDISDRSKEHICREFKKHYDMTPTVFINDIRLNYSVNLLLTTDESIPYIALESGFENLSHFYHLFKKRYDISPGEFRKIKRKNLIPT